MEPVNCTPSELSTYLQELAAGFLPTNSSDTSPSGQSSVISIASKSFRKGRKTVTFPGSRFSMTCAPSTGALGEAASMSSQADSPAKMSASPELVKGWLAVAQVFGESFVASSKKSRRSTSSSKTAPCWLAGAWTGSSKSLPRWGSMSFGVCLEQTPPDWLVAVKALRSRTGETAYGAWGGITKTVGAYAPTPTVHGNYNVKGLSPNSGDGLATWAWKTAANTEVVPTPTCNDLKNATLPPACEKWDILAGYLRRQGRADGGRLNPTWIEWLMGWPRGWSASEPLEMGKYQQWLRLHGQL